MKRPIIIYSLLIDLLVIFLITFLISYTTGYSFNYMIQSGDLRIHLNKEFIGDQFTSLFSSKFSNNNFIYLSFLPLFNFFEFLGYDFSLIYIYFGILILMYFTSKYSLILLSDNQNNKINIFLITSLCFYLTINPATFNRLGHYTILHSFIFFPLIVLFLYYYLRTKKFVYLCLLLVVSFFGNSAPNSVVVNTSTILVFPILFSFLSKEKVVAFLKSYSLIILSQLIALSHIIFPILLGMGNKKSIFESATSSYVLQSLSRNSNFFTSVSGTNYFYDVLIIYPHYLSIGLFIFCFGFLVTIISWQNISKLSLISLFFVSIYLLIVGGYNAYPFIYEFLLSLPIVSDFLWVIKDPNMFYQYFLYFVILIICMQLKHFELRKYIIPCSVFLLLGNFLYNYFSDVSNYRSFFEFIPKPNEYLEFVEYSRNTEYRNFWTPYNTYNSKVYSNNITYFPSPALWATENRELTNQTLEYTNLIRILENEIYNKDCVNKIYISWLIKTNRINMVIDRMTKNYPWIPGDDSEKKIISASECLKSIDSLKLFYTSKNLDSYVSNLSIDGTIYKLNGDTNFLISFVESNPSNIIFEETHDPSLFSVNKVENNFYILQESYDENWRDELGNGPRYKINLVNMAFDSVPREYRGMQAHKVLVYFQYALILIALVYSLYFFYRKFNEQ